MFDLPPPDPGIEFVIASRGITKGVAQTDGPQIVPKGFLQVGPVQLGAQWKNITSNVAEGETDLFMHAARDIGQFQVNLGVTYKFQTSVTEPTDDKSWEFSGGASRKFGKFSLQVSAFYSPDDLGGARQSLYVEGGPALQIGRSTKLLGTIGRRHREDGDDYTSFSASLTHTVYKGISLDVRWYDTTRHDLGKNYKGRAVVSAHLAF